MHGVAGCESPSYLPAAHGVHCEPPSVSEPGKHGLHVAAPLVRPVSVWYVFAGAQKATHADWPVALWNQPPGQLVHEEAPAWSLYVPTGQFLHGFLVSYLRAYLPASQIVHDVAREQPAALCRPAGQSAQALHFQP